MPGPTTPRIGCAVKRTDTGADAVVVRIQKVGRHNLYYLSDEPTVPRRRREFWSWSAKPVGVPQPCPSEDGSQPYTGKYKVFVNKYSHAGSGFARHATTVDTLDEAYESADYLLRSGYRFAFIEDEHGHRYPDRKDV